MLPIAFQTSKFIPPQSPGKRQTIMRSIRIYITTLVLITTTLWAEQKPNIILIISDDQGYADISAAGIRDDVSTPHLDRLASQGSQS